MIVQNFPLDITCAVVYCGHDVVDHDLMGELSICYACEDWHHFKGRE